MTLAIISHPSFVLHDAGPNHPERPERVKAVELGFKHFPFKNNVTHLEAQAATKDQLKAAHDATFVEWIFSIAPKHEVIEIDADTSMNPYTLNAALHAAGAVILAVDLVMKDKAKAAFCNVRPPGHHAERDKAMGFCLFNNVAVGVMHAIQQHAIERVAIIDFDVHHGNGTQNIFQKNKQVLYCSSFEYPFYPGYDEEMDNEHILSVPLPAGTSSETFRKKVSEAWFEKIALFQPQLIFFSAGFDAHQNDPLGHLKLVKDDYVWLTKEIACIAKVHSKGRMISVLEGGYNLEALAECAPAHADAMI